MQEIEKVLNMSYFVIPSTEEVWIEAIKAFNARNYHRSMVLIFPTLEHSLRKEIALEFYNAIGVYLYVKIIALNAW